MRFQRSVMIAALASVPLASFLYAQTQTTGTGLETMVLVPAGYFIRGSTSKEVDNAILMAKKIWGGAKDEWFKREMPQRRVYLDAFYIDKYPVTNVRFQRFGKPKDDYGSRFNSARQPVVGLIWSQARDYCGSVGKRLPTETEWEKAARGMDGREYPWGSQWDPLHVIWSRNSGDKTHPVDRTYNTHQSPYGAVDMSGNTWEWVGDWFKADYYQTASDRNPKGPSSGSERVIRGGSWNYDFSSWFRVASRSRGRPDNTRSDVGFRCAKTP